MRGGTAFLADGGDAWTLIFPRLDQSAGYPAKNDLVTTAPVPGWVGRIRHCPKGG